MRGLSLFANVGIAETYTKRHGLEIVVANELLEKRVKYYKEIYPSSLMINGDITNAGVYNEVINASLNAKVDFIIATPPCQGMSIAGKMEENDTRNSLIKYAINAIKDIQPLNAIIENVEGMLKTHLVHEGKKTNIIDYINAELKPLNYFINAKVINAANHGTPQSRRRAIFLISKCKPWEFPQTQEIITVREAIGHLPSLESDESSDIRYHEAKEHNIRHINAMKGTPSGRTAHDNLIHYPKKADGTKVKGFKTTYKRIEWDKPAPTITMANGSISSQNNVHPGRELKDGVYSDARVLTLKEIFILSGLPDDYTPPKWASENLIREVIGEGVPPRLIEALLSTIPNS